MSDTDDISMLIQSKTPIIVVETYDESRALELLTHIAIKNRQPLYSWTVTKGLVRRGFGEDFSPQNWTLVGDEPGKSSLPTETAMSPNPIADSPDLVLKYMQKLRPASVIVLCDFHPYLSEKPEHVRLLKDIALQYDTLGHTVILLSYALSIPPELKRMAALCQLRLPDDAQLMSIIREEGESYLRDTKTSNIQVEPGILNKLVRNLRGLSHSDARRLVRQVIRNDGEITKKDLRILNEAKFKLLDMDGIINFEQDTQSFHDVAGLTKLKEWIKLRDQAWHKPQEHHDRPRGVLLLGVQGGGKSLASRAIAGLWGLPLLRLDMAGLFNKYIGETERNLREALKLAEVLAPCVLWVDEIEKGMANGSSDEGTSQRVSGTLLTWMAENKSHVFIVATANEVSKLPPELLRKGRLDEIFFVDLPTDEARAQIFSIHLRKRNFEPNSFDMQQLLAASKGFSGAEIVQAIVSAVYRCAAENNLLDTAALINELNSTYPLSVLRAEEIQALREWAQSRTVMAD